MAVSIETGPVVTAGNLNPVQLTDFDAGPNVAFQGDGLLDPRYVSSVGTQPNVGRIYALYMNPQITLVDAFPQAPVAAGIATIAGSTGIATAAAGGTSIALSTTNQLGFAINVPMIPWVTARSNNPTTDGKVAGYGLSSVPQGWQSGNVVTAGVVLDFGATIFTLPAAATTTPTTLSSNSTTSQAVIPSSYGGNAYPANQILTVLAQSATNWKNPLKFYVPGQYVVIPGAGNAAGTNSLIAQVVALDFINNYMVISTPVLNTSANATGVGVGGADPNGVAAWPYYRAGADALMDPGQMVGRTIAVQTTGVSDGSILFTVQGYDVWGQPMTEQITSAGSATYTYGVKSWKYITSITASHAGTFTTTNTINIGTGATTGGSFGFPVRIDQFEYLSIFANGAYVTANSGFTAALASTTNPATYTSADVRGTYAMQTAPSGAVHLALYANVPQYQAAGSNNLNYQELFGVTQT